MGKLADWSAQQAPWVCDALHRAANCDAVSDADARAVANRVAAAHGIDLEGDHACIAFDEACLTTGQDAGETVTLCSIGPLGNVDRLAADQMLKFGLEGVTLIFGENGSGKSGYARAARRLCNARVPVRLQGDVYSEAEPQPPTIAFSYKLGDADPVSSDWTENDAPPIELAGMTFLDAANARVYVEGEAEILFLPSEVRCLTRLGQIYTAAAAICQNNADALSRRYAAAVGGHLDAATTAGQLVARLTTVTPLANLPTEEELRAAAAWTQANEDRLAALRAQLAQSPQAQAARLRRIATAAELVGNNAAASIRELSDEAITGGVGLVRSFEQARETAQTLAAAQIGGQPIAATGSDSWRQLFLYARQFAAESEIVPADGAFEVGDPCPLCQRPLDETSRDRLNAFDAYVEGQAARAVETARTAIVTRLVVLQALTPGTSDAVRQQLAELSAAGADEATLVADVISALDLLATRKNNAIAALEGQAHDANPAWNVAPFDRLRDYARDLTQQAEQLEQTGADAAAIGLEKELRDRKAVHDQLDEMIARRAGLAYRHRYLQCVDALNTRPVSLLATIVRGELVTPELRRRIESELADLGLDHVPLRFREASRAGRSFFEMALDTARRSDKESVLSEGEQRALAIACFLADSHVADSRGAIIVDDPVTSLDHQRLRKVARRFVREAGKGRQVIIFTHNLLFYQEVLRACAEHGPQVPALPCLVQQASGGFGLVSVDDQPWIAKKVRERERVLQAKLDAIPADLPTDGEEYRRLARDFYSDLRETWERAVEEVVLGGVVERFSSDVKTQSLKSVEVSDDDYRIIFFAMKRASERSGHDQAPGRQIDTPDKAQMEADLVELSDFIAKRKQAKNALEGRRRDLETAPRATTA